MSDRPREDNGVDWYASPKGTPFEDSYESPTRTRFEEEVERQRQRQLARPMYFPVSTTMLALLCLGTWGYYFTYWFFKNWQLQAERAGTGRYFGPAVRAVFSAFLAYGLFSDIERQAEVTRSREFNPAWLVVALWALAGCAALPKPYNIISLLSFLPLVAVQRTVNEINAKLAPTASRNERLNSWQTLVCWIGLIGLLLGFVGTVWPELAGGLKARH
jgi:hypothetical protein